MNYDERIARLMELARKVWPEGGEDFACEVEYDGIGYSIQDEAGFTVLLVRNHPLALDALEAALLVLAQEPSPAVKERHAKLVAVADKLNSLRRWIEGFARELEQRADRLDRSHAAMGKAFALREVAAELRERAKEGR